MIIQNNFTGFLKRTPVNKADRPVIKPDMRPFDWLLEAAALLGLMVLLGFTIYEFPKLPETIPTHFDGKGIPDDYSPKSTFWILPGISTFIYLLLSFIALMPHNFNFTVKITPANALRQYTLALTLIRYLKAAIIWLFFYISYATMRVVWKEDSGLGIWFLAITLGGILAPLIVYIYAASRNR